MDRVEPGTDGTPPAVSSAPLPMSGRKTEIVKLKAHTDHRGIVCEPMDPDMIPRWKNIQFAVTEPGVIRGNHRHVRGTESMVVTGPGLVCYRELKARHPDEGIAGDSREGDGGDGSGIAEFQLRAGEVMRFTFPPGVSHAFRNTGNTPTTLICFNTERHNPSQPDVEPDVLIGA